LASLARFSSCVEPEPHPDPDPDADPAPAPVPVPVPVPGNSPARVRVCVFVVKSIATLMGFVLRRRGWFALLLAVAFTQLGAALVVAMGRPGLSPVFATGLVVGGLLQLGMVLAFETAFEPDLGAAFEDLLRCVPSALLAGAPGVPGWALVAGSCAGPLRDWLRHSPVAGSGLALMVVFGTLGAAHWSLFGLLPFVCALRDRRGCVAAHHAASEIRRRFWRGYLLAAGAPLVGFYATAALLLGPPSAPRVFATWSAAAAALVLAAAGGVAAQALLARVVRPSARLSAASMLDA